MVVTQTANQPIAFSGQIVAYGQGVANTYQERTIVEVENTPIAFTNQSRQYNSSVDGNPAPYTTV